MKQNYNGLLNHSDRFRVIKHLSMIKCLITRDIKIGGRLRLRNYSRWLTTGKSTLHAKLMNVIPRSIGRPLPARAALTTRGACTSTAAVRAVTTMSVAFEPESELVI